MYLPIQFSNVFFFNPLEKENNSVDSLLSYIFNVQLLLTSCTPTLPIYRAAVVALLDITLAATPTSLS